MDERKIKQMVRACMNHLKKKEYELSITKLLVDRAVSVTKFTENEWRSRAGAYRISINIGYYKQYVGSYKAIEYAAYSEDPIIGARMVNSWQDHVLMVVAHEVSHHVQYAICKYISRFDKTYEKAHGKCFQMIYRYLRRDFVNPILDKNIEEAKELQRKTYFKMPLTIHSKSRIYEMLHKVMFRKFAAKKHLNVKDEFNSLSTLAKGTLISNELKLAIADCLKEVNLIFYHKTFFRNQRYQNKQRYLVGRRMRKILLKESLKIAA